MAITVLMDAFIGARGIRIIMGDNIAVIINLIIILVKDKDAFHLKSRCFIKAYRSIRK